MKKLIQLLSVMLVLTSPSDVLAGKNGSSGGNTNPSSDDGTGSRACGEIFLSKNQGSIAI
jgi:hypothetical protein